MRGLIHTFGFPNVVLDDSMTPVRDPLSITPWLLTLKMSR